MLETKHLSHVHANASPACWTGVIVGGGVTGCAMLYNLAKQGVKCVLFEKVSRKLFGWAKTGYLENWMVKYPSIEYQ